MWINDATNFSVKNCNLAKSINKQIVVCTLLIVHCSIWQNLFCSKPMKKGNQSQWDKKGKLIPIFLMGNVLHLIYSESIVCIFQQIFSLSFIQEEPHRQNSDETLAVKNRFAKVTSNTLYTIHVSSAFYCFIGVSSLFADNV